MKFTWSSWDCSVSLCLEPSLDPSPLQRFVLLFTWSLMCVALHLFKNYKTFIFLLFYFLNVFSSLSGAFLSWIVFYWRPMYLLFCLSVFIVDFQCHSHSPAQPWRHWLLSPCAQITPGVLEEPAGWRRACGHQPASPPTHSILPTRHESFFPSTICQGII